MVNKKRVTRSTKAVRKETKNIFAIIFGSLSILGSWIVPYNIIFGLLAIVGVVFAYQEKGKSSTKLNKWAITLSLIGIALIIIMLSLLFFSLMRFVQLPQ